MENNFYKDGIQYKKGIIEKYFPYGDWTILFEKLGTTSKKYIRKLGTKYGIKRLVKDKIKIKVFTKGNLNGSITSKKQGGQIPPIVEAGTKLA